MSHYAQAHQELAFTEFKFNNKRLEHLTELHTY